MSKRIKAADLPDFDAARYLDSEEAIAAYLTDILEPNDPALLAAALGDIARARGMSEIAKASGISREALYKALRADTHPIPVASSEQDRILRLQPTAYRE